MINSKVDKELQKIGSRIKFKGDEAEIKRSTSGPAVTLTITWREETISVDIVICLQADDFGNRYSAVIFLMR